MDVEVASEYVQVEKSGAFGLFVKGVIFLFINSVYFSISISESG